MEKILSGKPVAKAILDNLATNVQSLNHIPKMQIIKFGHDPAAEYYFNNVMKTGSKTGFDVQQTELPIEITNCDLLDIISVLSDKPDVDGVIIQKPVPKQIDDAEVSSMLNPDKDIDGINPLNLGKLFSNQDCFIPCTAAAVLELLKFYRISVSGKHVVILGRSTVVAKPLAALLLNKNQYGNATVTVCHSYSSDIVSIIRTADILVAAIGQPEYVKGDMIKPGAILIDVGINKVLNDQNNEIYVGDIDYKGCFDNAAALTPVPGGIGTITTSVLLKQLLKAGLLNSTKKIH